MAKIKRSIPLFESKWSGLMLLSDEEVGCIVKNLIRHANGKDTNVFTNDYIEAMFYILLDDLSTFDEHKEEERERKSEYRKKKGNMSADKNTCPTDIEKCPTDKNTCPDTERNGTELNLTERNGTELNCTELNGTDNNILSGKPDDAQTAPAEVAQIIDTLNLVLGTHYKSTTPKTVKLIHDRLKEGFTVSDFEIVIRKMFRVWTGTEYEKFLRPETLFGTKFESYLNRSDTTDKEIKAEKSKDGFRALYEWAARKEAERKEAETNDGDGFCADSGEDTCYLPDFSSC